MRTMGWAVSRGRTASHIRSVEYTQESPKYKEKLPLLEAWQEKLRDATPPMQPVFWSGPDGTVRLHC